MNQNRDFLTFLNGQVMPHRQAVAALQREGAQSSNGFYDAERTFNGQVFKLRKHLERLFSGLEYTGMNPGMTIEDMERVTLALVEANRSLLRPGEDFTVTQVVSLTQPLDPDEPPAVTTVIYCQLLDFTAFAHSYLRGVRLVTPATYGMPDIDADAKQGGQQVFQLMTNRKGIITECHVATPAGGVTLQKQGANFMFVRDGRIKLPDRSNVLPGVSMYTVLELAESLNVPVDEGDYSPYDVYTSDEAFISSTRYCLLPVATINGYTLGRNLPGPLTGRLLNAWKDLVGVDFVKQALVASGYDI